MTSRGRSGSRSGIDPAGSWSDTTKRPTARSPEALRTLSCQAKGAPAAGSGRAWVLVITRSAASIRVLAEPLAAYGVSGLPKPGKPAASTRGRLRVVHVPLRRAHARVVDHLVLRPGLEVDGEGLPGQ